MRAKLSIQNILNPFSSTSIFCSIIDGGFDTYWDGHHDGGVVSQGGEKMY